MIRSFIMYKKGKDPGITPRALPQRGVGVYLMVFGQLVVCSKNSI